MNLTPRIIFGNWLWPSRRRQFFSVASASLKIMASAVLFERHPLERTVRWRTVANEGHAEGYEAGRKVGHEAGHAEGYEGGREIGHEAGYAEGYRAGRDAGHEAGHAEGYEAGRKLGHEAAWP